MTEQTDGPAGAGGVAAWVGPGRNNVQLVYGLEILGLAFGLTGLVAVVFAYLNRSRADPWLQTHYTFQIRTFWIGLLFGAISLVLTTVLIGFLGLLATAVWLLIRAIKGLQAIARSEPIPNPQTWMF